MSHTPGPWYNVDDSFIHARFPHQNGEHVATVWAHGTAETAANARLIAAAPDLLEALEYVVEQFAYAPLGIGGIKVVEKARLAIAKSEGLLP